MNDWTHNYGDIVSMDMFGIPIIFIRSEEIAQELFEKRGALYSGRYPSHMAWLMGWEFLVGFIQYGEWWRRHVRVFHQFFNSRAVLSFEPNQMKARRKLLRKLLDTPESYSEHISFSVSHVVMDVVYAIDIKPKNDYFINIIHTALDGLGHAFIPGLWLVDPLPIFKYVPSWFPGLKFKNFARKYRDATVAVTEIPFNVVKNRETHDYSLVSTALERLRAVEDPLPDEETVIKNVAATVYAAGVSTTSSAILQTLVASILYPEGQKKMQDELDKVLGDRLPTLADRKDLPYVNAFLYEVLRWRPSLPLGVPHATLEDDVYGKYFIPKGSIVIGDSWAILRDKKYGPDPEIFIPERFLQPGIPSPIEHFGFGRRICPGRFFAENALFLFMASIFKVFDVTPMKDEDGKDIPVSDKITDSALPFPVPFQCSFKLRSSLAKELILSDNDD